MNASSSKSLGKYSKHLQPFSKFFENHTAAVIFLILGHLAIVLPLAAILNIWFDEAYSLRTTGNDAVFAVQQGLNYDWMPPLYPLLLNLWRNISPSIFFARLFSIICTVSIVYSTFLLSKRFIKNIHPAWTTAAVAFNPYLIWAAVEIRLYAMAALFSVLLLLFFFDGYLAETSSLRARRIHFLLAILGLYTHFFIAFVLVGNGLALISVKRWKALWDYCIPTAIAGLCFFPFFLLLAGRLSDRLEAYSDPVSLTSSLSFVFLSIVNSIVYVWKEPTFLSRGLRVAWGIILPIVCIFLVSKNRQAIQPNHIALWVSTAGTGLLLAAFLTSTSTETLERYIYPLFVPSILSFFSILSLGKSAVSRSRNLRIWAGILSCFFGLSLLTIYHPLAKSGDWSRVASYLMSAEGNNQPILVFNTEVEMMLKSYYSGKNSIVPIPREQKFEKFNTADFRIQDEQELIDTFAKLPKEQKTVWLVTSQMHCPAIGSVPSIKYGSYQNCEALMDFLSKHYSVQSVQHFYESIVQQLKKQSDF